MKGTFSLCMQERRNSSVIETTISNTLSAYRTTVGSENMKYSLSTQESQRAYADKEYGLCMFYLVSITRHYSPSKQQVLISHIF